jgi:8-oxo-dGTP pyrophosphatase MutT (NUDIX family)
MMLADRLGAALAAGMAEPAPVLPGDHVDLAGLPFDQVTAAAVLVPVTDRAEPGVILTQRPDTMRRHAGQVAFPGGRVDPGDDGAIAAALREAQEEIALPPSQVTVVGITDAYRTVTGDEVTPVVGVVTPDLVLVPSADEVAAVFEVPLAFLLDPANHRRVAREWQGRERRYYEILWRDRRIWGATAAMIVNLSLRLKGFA